MGNYRYAVATDSRDGQTLAVLEDAEGGRRLQAALHGGVVFGFSVTVNGVAHELAKGYRSGEEITKRPGSRFAILAPFAGRIADARYTFDRHMQDLDPGVTSGARGSRHGFVRDADFELIASDADDDHASVTLATRAIRLEPGAERVFRCGVELDIAA